jgi:4-hydroxy-4-methyl-2-oxoglutarate aldolase
MIDEVPLLTIRRRFSRPSADQVAAFQGLPTGFVADALLAARGGGKSALDGRVKPIAESGPFCGVVVPCEAGPADNLAVFGALDIAQPGDVVIAGTDFFTEAAIIGDLLLGMLRNKGVVAFVTDGFVRDIVGLRAVGLPCYASGVTPNSPAKNGPGTVGLPVQVGGVLVGPGDIAVGDEDGVVVVPHAMIGATIDKLPAIKAAEATMDARVKGGLKQPDFWAALSGSGRFREVD